MTEWWGQLARSFPASRGLSVYLWTSCEGSRTRTPGTLPLLDGDPQRFGPSWWTAPLNTCSLKQNKAETQKTWSSHSQPSRDAAVPRTFLITSLQAFSKYLVVYVYLNGSKLLVPSPLSRPVTPCWFDVTVLDRTILEPRCGVGGCFASGGSCQWDQSFDRLSAPRWPLPWKTSQLQVLRPLLAPEPVPWWGYLAMALPHQEGGFGILADSPLGLLLPRWPHLFSSCSLCLSYSLLSPRLPQQ